MLLPRTVFHVLTILFHLGTSDGSHNQGQPHAPKNEQSPRVEIIKVWQISKFPHLLITLVNQSTLYLPIMNPPVSTSLFAIWPWGLVRTVLVNVHHQPNLTENYYPSDWRSDRTQFPGEEAWQRAEQETERRTLSPTLHSVVASPPQPFNF